MLIRILFIVLTCLAAYGYPYASETLTMLFALFLMIYYTVIHSLLVGLNASSVGDKLSDANDGFQAFTVYALAAVTIFFTSPYPWVALIGVPWIALQFSTNVTSLLIALGIIQIVENPDDE